MSPKIDTNDKVQIGLTAVGAQHLASVMKTGWFEKEQDAYRLAIAVALAHQVVASPDQISGSDVKFNFMGGIDRDGRVRALIGALAPAEGALPARYAERLAHAGLNILASKLADEEALLIDAMRSPTTTAPTAGS